MKLAQLKNAINVMTGVLERAAPEIKAELPVSKLIQRLCKLLLEASRLAPKDFYQDRNYPRVVSVFGKVLVFIAEEDGHYAGQLSQAMLLTHDLVAESRSQFPPGQEGDVAWMHWASRQPIIRVKSFE